ncbi:hypothetical protein ATSB10_16490 [Dyella thiooxydans]|uniref:GYF domain-containing protein n=2 Tax=Dyella thiooxydans TaxID=445710 RepID=A0A160N028_9GAMM|nr:hypothetical protein ATSB10_16490 [Dyella thiooxydans]
MLLMSPTAWHYQDGQRAVGPVEEDVIRRRLSEGRMQAGTLVWCEGMSGWAPVEQTLFAAEVPLRITPAAASAQASVRVNPAVAWLIACLPFALLLLSPVPGSGLIGMVAYIALALHDRRQLQRAGRPLLHAGWWLILLGGVGAPIYLSLRAGMLGDRRDYVLVSLLAIAMFFLFALQGGMPA